MSLLSLQCIEKVAKPYFLISAKGLFRLHSSFSSPYKFQVISSAHRFVFWYVLSIFHSTFNEIGHLFSSHCFPLNLGQCSMLLVSLFFFRVKSVEMMRSVSAHTPLYRKGTQRNMFFLLLLYQDMLCNIYAHSSIPLNSGQVLIPVTRIIAPNSNSLLWTGQVSDCI